MMGRYTNKVVLVTGAGTTTGIGFAIARSMLQEGAKVFICDLNTEALQRVLAELKQYGEVDGAPADVSDEASVAGMIQALLSRFGKIDVLVNNAGIYPQKLLMDMPVEQWDAVMRVNLRSVFLCTKAAFTSYMKEHGGVVINAASFAALMASAESGAYASSKSAVFSLTKTLAAELAPFGIRVNGFIPGVIATGMTAGVLRERSEQLVSQIALHRAGQPQDVANAVLYLASEDASYITGTFLEVSGGKLCVQNPNLPYQRLEENHA